LQVDYNAPDPQVLLPSGSPAAKVGWVTCGSTGPGAVWVPTFVETDASNAGWYQLIPNARPGVPTPCLNLNLGASQSTQMLVEYTCQGGTHTEERWAPNESFWTAPGGTGGTGGTPTTTTATTIPSSTGGYGDAGPYPLLRDSQMTFLHDFNRSSCLGFSGNTLRDVPYSNENCLTFFPMAEVDRNGDQTYRGVRLSTENGCLEALPGGGAGVSGCNDSAAQNFQDVIGSLPNRFSQDLFTLRSVSASGISCLTRNSSGAVDFQPCDPSSPSQNWADYPSGSEANLKTITLQSLRSAAQTVARLNRYNEFVNQLEFGFNYLADQALAQNIRVVFPHFRGDVAGVTLVNGVAIADNPIPGPNTYEKNRDACTGPSGFVGPALDAASRFKNSSGSLIFDNNSTIATAIYCIDLKFGSVFAEKGRNPSTFGRLKNRGAIYPLPVTADTFEQTPPWWDANSNFQNWHAESNVLGRIMVESQMTPASVGQIYLHTSRTPCPSCAALFQRFRANFPLVRLRVWYPEVAWG
jgi:Novel AID APOBEC clade 1